MYERRRVKPVAFTVVVARGPHLLRVRYAAEAARHLYGHPTVYHQFAYVLAPARAWSEFGGLDLAIRLPRSCCGPATPGLTRQGDTLTGGFADVPADAIALTCRRPRAGPMRRSFTALPCSSAWHVSSGRACAGVAVDRRAKPWRARQSLGRAGLNDSLGRGHSAWAPCTAWPCWPAEAPAALGPDWVLPAGQASHYGYSDPSFMFVVVSFLSALAVPLGFVIAQLTAVIVRRRAAAKGGRTPKRMAHIA